MRLPTLVLIAALATPLAAPAAESEVTLMNGEVVHCEVVRESDTAIVIRRPMLNRGKRTVAEVELSKDQVGNRRTVEPLAKQYADLKKTTPDTVIDQQILARWCAERCLVDESKTHALRALAIDPTAKQARDVLALLGYLEVKGAWVVEDEYLTTNNLARWGEKIIPAAEAAQRRELQKAIAERDAAMQQVRDDETAIALTEPKAQTEQERKVADLERQAAAAAAEQERGKSQLQASAQRIQALTQQRAQSNTGPNRAKQLQDQIATEQKKQQDLQKQIADADGKARTTKRQAETEKKKLDNAKKNGETAKADLPNARLRLEKARAEVTRLSQGLSDLPPNIKEPAEAPPVTVDGKPPKPKPVVAPASGDGAASPPAGAARL